jgi:hypothetical protein
MEQAQNVLHLLKAAIGHGKNIARHAITEILKILQSNPESALSEAKKRLQVRHPVPPPYAGIGCATQHDLHNR